MKILNDAFTKKLLFFIALQGVVLVGLVWFIAGNERLFLSTVPIEQRLVSRHETIRKKAQQELLGLGEDRKRHVVSRLLPALDHEDAIVRKWAAIALALIGPGAQDAIPALLQNMSSKERDVVQASRVALSEIGAPDVQQLPSLLRTLQDPRESVRCEAALSIGKMGPAAGEAVPLLIHFLKQVSQTPVCIELALGAVAGMYPPALPPVIELLESGHVEIRRKAAHVLSQAPLKTRESVAPVLRAVAVESDAEVRGRLIKALSMPETRVEGQVPLWTAALKSSVNEVVRLNALDFLRRVTPPPENLQEIWGIGLRDSSPVLRLEMARWIRDRVPRGRSSLPAVLRMLKDSEPEIRRLGLETLRYSGVRSPELLQKVGKAQRDEDPGVRCRAAETLIESGALDRVSLPLLIKDLRQEEDTARCAEEVLGLAGLFDAEVTRFMIRLVQEETRMDVRSRAARVLMHLGPRAREAIPALLHAQKDNVPGATMALRAVRTGGTSRRR